MTATVAPTGTRIALVETCKAANPSDSLPWLVLADWLDENGETDTAHRVRWWRHHRAELVAVDWSNLKPVDWYNDVGPRIDTMSKSCRWFGRLYGIEVYRAVAEKYPLPKFNGRAEIVRTIRATLAVAECHAMKLATDSELSAAESAVESAAWSAAWSAARSAARSAAESAAESATESAARSAARSATWSAAWSATWSATWSAAWSAAESATWSAAESAARSAAESATWSATWSAARSAAEQILRRFEGMISEAGNL